jgi:DNA-binding transcriptional LysR family regulator
MMTGNEFAELTAFLAVSEERSFRRAAKRLGASPSALSRTIRRLEDRLAVRLLNRTTRSVAPTQAGLELAGRLRPAMSSIDMAVREVTGRQERPSGLLRINASGVAARLTIMPVLTSFLAEYPEIRLDLVIDDTLSDVVGEGFDAGIRSGRDVHRDMIAVRLTDDLKMIVVGSPSYFELHGVPGSPHDLTGHRCITYRWDDTGALFPWRFDGPEGPFEIDANEIFTVNDADLVLAAARSGAGLALLAESFVEKAVEAGELVPVLAAWTRPFAGFHLYHSSRAQMPAALRALIDFLKAQRSSSASEASPVTLERRNRGRR